MSRNFGMTCAGADGMVILLGYAYEGFPARERARGRVKSIKIMISDLRRYGGYAQLRYGNRVIWQRGNPPEKIS